MSSSLQRQLAALAGPASSLLQPERKRVSVIFTPEEAAKYDKETFYQIGLDGLNELIPVCPDLFTPFRNSILFSEASKSFERSVEDAAVNAKVDETVERFLLTLSPYLMLKAALKCVEWLIYRFHIERYNIESIMECIMPYYDTKHFVSIIQVLQFGSTRDRATVDWEWLAPSIQSATVLRKATLYGNINGPFVLWLFETLKKLLEVHRSHQDNLSTYLGFMVSTIVGIVTKFSREFSIQRQYNRVKSKKSIVHVVLNQIYALFEEILFESKYESVRNNREVFSIAYVIIATIGVTAEENPEIGGILGGKIKGIFNLLIKNRNVALLEETYMLIDMLVHHIYFEWTIKQHKPFHTAMMDLSVVSQNWDVSKVVSRLLLANAENPNVLNPRKIFDYLSSVHLNPEIRADVLSKLYFKYKEMAQEDQKKKNYAKTLLIRFEREYPSEFELACQSEPKLADYLAKIRNGKDILLMVEHPDEALRAKAVKKLIIRATRSLDDSTVSRRKKIRKKKSQPDHNPTANALLSRFSDESQDVVCALLKSKLKKLLQIFSAEALLQGCITVLQNKRGSAGVRLALKKICLLAMKVELDENLEKKALTAMIPFLFPRKPPGVITAKKIICSSFAQDNGILKNYQPLANKIHEISPEEFCRHSYEVWTTLEGHQLGHLDSKNAVELTIAFLLLKDEHELSGLLQSAVQVGFRSAGNLPMSPSDFPKCLIVAEKKGCVSVELILSAILKIDVPSVSTQMLVIKFVWSLSESEKHRGTCLNFLKAFIPKIYPEPTRQYWFWLLALHKTASLQQEENQCSSEFYLIRCLQFFSRFVKDFGIPASTNIYYSKSPQKASSSQETPHKPLTRSRGKVEEIEPLESELQQTKATSGKSPRRRDKSGRDIVREGVSPTWCLLEVIFAECLQHPSHRVRALSMRFLGVIKQVPKLSVDWEDLVGSILAYETEIIADSSQAATLIGKTIVDADLTSVRSQIIKTIINEETDKGIFMGLVNICQHTGALIYTELEPMIKKLLDTDPESQQLLALLNCFDATPQSIEIVPRLLESRGAAKVIFKQINSKLFKTANNDFKRQLYCLMVDLAVSCKLPEVKLNIQRCVRKWEVDSALISEELKKCMGAERLASAAVSTKLKDGKWADADGLHGWKDRAEVILEFVQGMKKLKDTRKLLPPLFRILKICISLEQQSSVEYLKQLTLTALTMCCQDETEEQQVDSGTFHVDLVIDCLRCSRNPQTHHHALILLNYAAKRFHEQVLHGVMSLFTFMGNSILRQDDTYSTQLIQQTVITIIPSLTKAGKGNSPQFSRTVVSSGIFRVFASALQDIPVHRRLPVFTSLVETLEPSECLWQVLIILVDNARNRDSKKSNLIPDLELAVDLAWFFGPKVVIKSLARVYEFFISMASMFKSNVTVDEFRHFKTGQSPIEKAVFDFSRKDNYRDIQLVVYYTVELMMKIATKFADLGSDEKLEYDVLLERCLAFSKTVSGLTEDKNFRSIAQKNMAVMDKINAVLEAGDFVRVIAVALQRNEISIKRKLLDILNLRLSQKIEWFGDLTILLPMLQPLLEIAGLEPENEETVTLVQSAFVSLKLIAKHLAFSHPDEFIPVFQLALSRSSHENNLLCATALICLGELFCLKSLLLPNLNDVTSAILRALKTSSKLHKVGKQLQHRSEETLEESGLNTSQIWKEGNNSSTAAAHLLCLSTIACMNKMAEQMGPMMGSKFLRKALTLILTIDTQQSLGEMTSRRKIFDQRIRVLLKTLASKIPVRNSLASLKDAFNSLVGMPRAAKAVMYILKDALQATAKPDFLLILPPLCDTFVEEFLAYRFSLAGLQPEAELENGAKSLDDEDENITEVEDAVIDCLISGAVLKMSEGAFRPYYHKLFESARDSDVKLVTFYRFSASAAEKLKSLFVTFAGYVMNEAVGSLDKNVPLTKAVLNFFYQLFSNDREGFVTTDRFNTLVKPLVELMESDVILSGQIAVKVLSDTLIQLAVASNDLNRWQHMIDLISTKAHHSDKRVRLNVISVLEAAAAELGKDFLPLLPPVVPFVAELMNDDEPEVESATQKMLLKLETIVGEPLQPYFT